MLCPFELDTAVEHFAIVSGCAEKIERTYPVVWLSRKLNPKLAKLRAEAIMDCRL
jgi:hypothetical protein